MVFGDLSYILCLITLTCIFILIWILLRNKDQSYIYKFLLIWCFIGFGLHFLKQLVYLDVNFLHKSTPENICAVCTLTFPFIMLIKNKNHCFKDFMYFMGFMAGICGLIYPTEVLGKTVFCFESIRFYFCHFSLFAIPMLLAIFNISRPRLKMVFFIPLIFSIVQLIICANTALWCFTGVNTREGYTALELFLDNQYCNNSFTFGPTPDMGKAGEFIGSLCPNFMKIDIFNINGGKTTYWPVIWLIIPTYILFTPLYLLTGLPFFIKKK